MTDDFDTLLARMGDVAAAVNAFTSESVQQLAFQALIAVFAGKPISAAGAHPVNEISEEDEPSQTKKGRSKSKRPKSSPSARDQVEAVRNLDLRPQGKTSFLDFVAEKQPASNQDKYAVAVYWMEQIAGINPVTVAHVAAIFKQTPGWREPNNLRVGLTTTATRKNTLDTGDLNGLKTTPHGRNFVEHDLPPKD
jgi:hypothetical protein